MKIVEYPPTSWLKRSTFDRLCAEHDRAWGRVDAFEPDQSDPRDYLRRQNEAMLLKFFLEQAFGDGVVGGRAAKLLERDGGAQRFSEQFFGLAPDPNIEWIVWGLSFASFRFHLFPLAPRSGEVPFCISPMLVACVREDVVAEAGVTRAEFARLQYQHLDWTVVESRIACLEKPLDLFAEPTDCAPDDCSPNATVQSTIE